MNNENLENEIQLESLSSFDIGKFSVVSKIYGKDFSTVTFVILNSKTGELRKEVFNNEISTEDDVTMSDEEANEYDAIIKAETANNIQDEIDRLKYNPIKGEAEYIWNHTLDKASECCNRYHCDSGYELSQRCIEGD